jgi:hypothetical protein
MSGITRNQVAEARDKIERFGVGFAISRDLQARYSK